MGLVVKRMANGFQATINLFLQHKFTLVFTRPFENVLHKDLHVH